nr:CAAX protease [Helicobacter pylori]
MQDLQDFKNDITLILSKDRLETYDNLEQYKENLKLISLITPKISNLEIYLRNALDYCLTQIKGNEWVFDEVSLIPLIEELKEKKKEITHSLILSKMSLGAVIRLIFCYKLEGVVLDLRTYSLKAYYKDNKDTLLIKGRKQHLSNYAKAYIYFFKLTMDN